MRVDPRMRPRTVYRVLVVAILSALAAGLACSSRAQPKTSEERPSSEVEPYPEGTTQEVSSCSECAKIVRLRLGLWA